MEDLSSDDISCPEEIASLRAELIALLGYEFPKALIANTLLTGVFEFLEVVLLLGEGGGDESLVAGVLEVDDVMRFYLLLFLGVFETTMQDKFPQALALVLVYYVDPSVDGLLYGRTALGVLVAGLTGLEGGCFIGPVEDDGDVSVGEVHVAIGLGVMDAEAVIVVNLVAYFFIRPMGDDAEVEEAGEFLH